MSAAVVTFLAIIGDVVKLLASQSYCCSSTATALAISNAVLVHLLARVSAMGGTTCSFSIADLQSVIRVPRPLLESIPRAYVWHSNVALLIQVFLNAATPLPTL